MRVNDDYAEWNAELQVADPSSILSHWRRVLDVRKEHWDVFIYGRFVMVDRDHPHVFCYKRLGQRISATIVANFTDEDCRWVLPRGMAASIARGKVILANYGESRQLDGGVLCLRPYESFVALEEEGDREQMEVC